MRILILLVALTAGSSRVAYAQPVEVASGEDLGAWQELEQRRLAGADAVLAYRSFVLLYPESPLAVAAWGRLVELGEASEDWAQAGPARAAVASVRRAWEAHRSALDEATSRAPSVAVLELGTDDTGE